MLYQTSVSKWGLRYYFTVGWAIVSLIALNYHQSMIFPTTALSWVYYISTFIGHYGLLIFIVYYLLHWPVVKLFPNIKLARIWAIIILLSSSMMLFIDSMVFAQYRFHLNGFIFDMIFGGGFGDIFEFPLITYFIISFIIFIKVLIFWFFGKRINSDEQYNYPPKKRYFVTFLFFCFLTSHFVHAYANAVGMKSVTTIANLFPLNFPLTANSFLVKTGIVDKAQMRIIRNDNSTDFTYPTKEMVCTNKPKKNILLIVGDSWRADELSEEITPYLHELSKDGKIFKRHFSGSNNTRAGIFNIFYGLPASYWSLALNNRKSPVFVDKLQQENYELGIFASATLTSPEFDRTVFTKVKNLRLRTQGQGAVERDLKINMEWKEWIANYKESASTNPFFGFLFYDSPHSYAFPKDFKKEYDPIASSINYLAINNFTDPLPILNLHRKSVSFIDHLIKEVIEDLKAKKLYKDTIIVVTSDHGQEINDNKKNYWGHNSNYSAAQTQVPLLIVWPDKKFPKNYDGITTHYDLVPTLMQEIWGCSNNVNDYSFGQNLFHYESKNSLIVASYLDFGILDFNKKQIQIIDQFGRHNTTDLNLNIMDNSDNSKLINVIKELKRFKF